MLLKLVQSLAETGACLVAEIGSVHYTTHIQLLEPEESCKQIKKNKRKRSVNTANQQTNRNQQGSYRKSEIRQENHPLLLISFIILAHSQFFAIFQFLFTGMKMMSHRDAANFAGYRATLTGTGLILFFCWAIYSLSGDSDRFSRC